jgi:hypothetical protein
MRVTLERVNTTTHRHRVRVAKDTVRSRGSRAFRVSRWRHGSAGCGVPDGRAPRGRLDAWTPDTLNSPAGGRRPRL